VGVYTYMQLHNMYLFNTILIPIHCIQKLIPLEGIHVCNGAAAFIATHDCHQTQNFGMKLNVHTGYFFKSQHRIWNKYEILLKTWSGQHTHVIWWEIPVIIFIFFLITPKFNGKLYKYYRKMVESMSRKSYYNWPDFLCNCLYSFSTLIYTHM
jgi:hypothetical protein